MLQAPAGEAGELRLIWSSHFSYVRAKEVRYRVSPPLLSDDLRFDNGGE